MLEMFLKSDIKYRLGRQNDYYYNFIWNRHEQEGSQFSITLHATFKAQLSYVELVKYYSKNARGVICNTKQK